MGPLRARLRVMVEETSTGQFLNEIELNKKEAVVTGKANEQMLVAEIQRRPQSKDLQTSGGASCEPR